MKKAIVVSAVIFAGYLAIGYFLHLVVFPEPEVEISGYFQPGDVLESKTEGVKLIVQRQENGKLYCRVKLEPHAEGPPLHIHSEFDETFISDVPGVNIVRGGSHIEAEPGKEYLVKRGTPHRFFSVSDSTIEMEMRDSAVPVKFAVYLSQVYGYFDEDPDHIKPPGVILQMAMFNQYFDSYLAEAPPVIVLKSINFLVIPLARLLGYQSFYDKYRL